MKRPVSGDKGLLCVISSPSGGGKTTIVREILKKKHSFQYSVSATTRPRRKNEVNGRDYYFLNDEEFRKKIKKGEFVEWAEVYGYLYGTPKAMVEKALRENKVVLLDLDVCGGLEVKRKYPDSSVLIFLDPPSMQSLLERLKKRKTDTEQEIRKRMKRVPEEVEKAKLYDFRVVNKDIKNSVEKIMHIIRERMKN